MSSFWPRILVNAEESIKPTCMYTQYKRDHNVCVHWFCTYFLVSNNNLFKPLGLIYPLCIRSVI